MADRNLADVLRENEYLKRRNAQLQSDVLDLSAENHRLRQIQDRLHGRKAGHLPDPLGGGQSS